jgi:hypothetical protein
MIHPWLKYRRIGGPIIRPIAWWWPITWQGWLCFLGLAVLWLGGGNAITLLVFPVDARAGWISLGLLFLVSMALFQIVLRYKGIETGQRVKDEDYK